ncbi:Transposase [Phytophthora cinnamomi]|uniref:Transposase n=1 Tax=Phytophthora cinnamomi TaxID=4785 RepID=UPI00355A8B08|nr:Transposase [Phytophthora cinnamomi]
MAFYKIGHRSLLDALQLLNPGVEVPSADQLSTTLLDRAYTKSLKTMEKSLSGRMATLVSDAWTDINGQPVMNYVVVCGKNTHFLESVYTGARAHDTEYLTADIGRVIAKYSFLKIGAVVTDNTRANQATWKALKAKFPKTSFHGLFLAGKTKKQKKKHREVYDLVTSDTFLPRLKKAVAVLKPIGKILKRFERNETPLSEVYHEFCELPSSIEEAGLTASDTNPVKALIEKRFEFVYGEAHGLAYLLDPRYEGVKLEAKRRGDVENSLCQWHGTDDEDAVMLELASFNRYLRELKDSTSRQWILLRDG